MDERVAILASTLEETGAVMDDIPADQGALPTPCPDFDVAALLSHMAVWVQVFDHAVNDTPLDFDPSTAVIEGDWVGILRPAAARIVEGLRARGFDRPMTMTADPIPGEFVLNMLLMEYIAHGWDLCRATGRPAPYRDVEATTALDAARAILRPQYRGSGMFEAEVTVPADAPPMDRLVAFLGRDPQWAT